MNSTGGCVGTSGRCCSCCGRGCICGRALSLFRLLTVCCSGIWVDGLGWKEGCGGGEVTLDGMELLLEVEAVEVEEDDADVVAVGGFRGVRF